LILRTNSIVDKMYQAESWEVLEQNEVHLPLLLTRIKNIIQL